MVRGYLYTQYNPARSIVRKGYIYYCCITDGFIFDSICRGCCFSSLRNHGKYNGCEDAVEVVPGKNGKIFTREAVYMYHNKGEKQNGN